MASIWPLIDKHSIYADLAAVGHWFMMWAYITAFNWIEFIFCQGETTPNESWPMQLVKTIKSTVDLVGTKAHPVHFSSKDYIPALHAQTYVYIIPGFGWRTPKELDKLVNNTFYRIVSHWLGFPRQDLFCTQAVLALSIGTIFGDVLMLDEMWHGFMEPQSIIIGLPLCTRSAVTSTQFDAFIVKLHHHPFACSPPHISAIITLFELRQMWQSGLQKLTAPFTDVQSTIPSTLLGGGTVSGPAPTSNAMSPEVQAAEEEKKMASFLNYLVKVNESYSPSYDFGNSPSGNRKYLLQIQQNCDYLSPF